MNLSCGDVIGRADPRGSPDPVTDPAAALRLANKAAARALRCRAHGRARDVAADALLLLLEKRKPFCRSSIVATVKHLARRASRRAALEQPLPADWREGEGDPAEASAPETSEPPAPRGQPFSRTFADGSTARIDGGLCEADVAALTLERADGSVLRDREALHAAHRLLLAERFGAGGARQAVNARRAATALSRDALLLAVAGLPWREALARLAAQGVHVSRDGLRSGQRAARLRCAGRAAHERSRAPDLHGSGGAVPVPPGDTGYDVSRRALY